MSGPSKARPAYKIWLETDEGYVFGPGVYSLLRKIGETGTLKGAAEALGMSYRFAWGLLRKAEDKLGEPLVLSHKGGRSGGGGVEITEVGFRFLEEFSEIEYAISRFSEESRLPHEYVVVNAKVLKMDPVGDDVVITFHWAEPTNLKLSLSKEKVEDLDISQGDRVRLEITPAVNKIKKI